MLILGCCLPPYQNFWLGACRGHQHATSDDTLWSPPPRCLGHSRRWGFVTKQRKSAPTKFGRTTSPPKLSSNLYTKNSQTNQINSRQTILLRRCKASWTRTVETIEKGLEPNTTAMARLLYSAKHDDKASEKQHNNKLQHKREWTCYNTRQISRFQLNTQKTYIF